MNQQGEGTWNRVIYITRFDLARLKELLEVGTTLKERDREYLEI